MSGIPFSRKQRTRLNAKIRRFLRNKAVPAPETTNCDTCNAVVSLDEGTVTDGHPVSCEVCDKKQQERKPDTIVAPRAIQIRGRYYKSGSRLPPIGYEEGMDGLPVPVVVTTKRKVGVKS